MQLNQKYASYLISAANVYAGQRSTDCKAAESWFEQRLLTLFEQASQSGVEQQDLAVIASTALAVALTKQTPTADNDCNAESSKKNIRVLRPSAKKE
jgi:hypothetical protein